MAKFVRDCGSGFVAERGRNRLGGSGHTPDVNRQSSLYQHVIGEQGRQGDIGAGARGQNAENAQQVTERPRAAESHHGRDHGLLLGGWHCITRSQEPPAEPGGDARLHPAGVILLSPKSCAIPDRRGGEKLSKTEQTVSLPRSMTDVLEGGSKQSIVLAVYGLAVLSVERQL